MQYVYILKSKKDNNLYVGCTKNMKDRIALHNSGQVESTRGRRPMELIHYEAFLSTKDAFVREKWLKTGWGKNHLEKMLSNYQKSLGG
ncbi:MAG TPA: GIY-YIG nuclease family protein [Candidatus Angelobacter sp.]|nr:GIY-YIG nuclease family protein [Candidatus Angelobacter sp.]